MSDTPYGKILKSLADLAKLPDDENYRVSRNFVMREVVTIRENADLLEHENADLRSDIERHVQAAADLANENAYLRAELNEAAYALFQIKRMTPVDVRQFAAEAHAKACAFLDVGAAIAAGKVEK